MVCRFRKYAFGRGGEGDLEFLALLTLPLPPSFLSLFVILIGKKAMLFEGEGLTPLKKSWSILAYVAIKLQKKKLNYHPVVLTSQINLSQFSEVLEEPPAEKSFFLDFRYTPKGLEINFSFKKCFPNRL